MNRKEVTELKKQFTMAGNSLTKIVGWLIDGDKEVILGYKEKILGIDEIVFFKFLDIFKKGLTGKFGKNLYNLQITHLERKTSLKAIVKDKLKGKYEPLLEIIRQQYEHEGRYAVFVAHGIYDIPGKATDGTEMEDASDEVYEYMMVCICPVALQKPGISFDKEGLKEAERKWIVMDPETAFVYPAFNDRGTDYDHVWFYVKKEPSEELVKDILSCEMPETPQMQKEAFCNMAGEKYELERAKKIYSDLQALALCGDIGVPVTKNQIEKVLGVELTKEDTEVFLQNIINLKRFDINMTDANITVAADRTDLVREQTIDGEEYILVKKNGCVTVNGIELGGEEDVN